jgi:protein arginine kinase
MNKSDIFAGWMKGDGPEADIVVSSRVRLARNLDNAAFTHVASDDDLEKVLNMVEGAAKADKRFSNMELIKLDQLSPIDRELLVIRHLISPELAQLWTKRAVILGDHDEISIMINEEDHLRMQGLLSGLQFQRAWEMVDEVDDLMEKKLNYAFSEKIGYLTACPTNAGTGLRGSVMLHLPALKATNQIGAILNVISKLGFAIRGFYGEGTESVGDMYQISNQVTLGQSETDILGNLSATTKQIINQEREARQAILTRHRAKVEDITYRSYGILKNARILSSEEAMKLISDIRMGAHMDILKDIPPSTINELMVLISPTYINKALGKKDMSAQERDIKRAELVREILK